MYVDSVKLASGADASPDQIREAERDVRIATRSAIYDTNASGAPTKPEIVTAFAEATRLQVLAREAALGALQRAEALSPIGRPLSSASIGGASYTADSSTARPGDELAIAPGSPLCAGAWAVLFEAGLLYGEVAIYG